MANNINDEVIRMLTPKIKRLLKQTTQQNQEDLEQELILLVLTTINKNQFLDEPSFFYLIESEEL